MKDRDTLIREVVQELKNKISFWMNEGLRYVMLPTGNRHAEEKNESRSAGGVTEGVEVSGAGAASAGVRAGRAGIGVFMSRDRAKGQLSILGAREEAREALPDIRSLDQLESFLRNCTRCRLHEGRTNLVFGTGDPHADIMFVGEAPGREEDLKGEPFVGRAGQLLDQMLAAAGLGRAEVYIANIVKCRPPENRNPQQDEIDACMPFLVMQIRFIAPKIICALGSVAFQALTGSKVSISKVRGRFIEYEGRFLLPTYHPAFILRNPYRREEGIEDLRKLKKKRDESG